MASEPTGPARIYATIEPSALIGAPGPINGSQGAISSRSSRTPAA
jgi:hypothetical protein